MLRIISERTLETDEDLCVCFCKQGFDRVNWTKLMQILKGIGIDWRERRLISNLYMAQSTTEPWGDKNCEDWKMS